MAIKVADMGGNCTRLPQYLRWVGVLEEEMFLQGDKEKALGLPVSPLCDRAKGGVSTSQVRTSGRTAVRPLPWQGLLNSGCVATVRRPGQLLR
jgi:hypothetical protein